ncbi:hypothetical protein [Acidobacterium sp. S8]|uniref:hypothetical protein n=1 Tax=Acidobacterium sp. S8 TaxID=1641854 RepID=UPI0020B10D6F|nr:hypothetical protein [Acidobacterium sp. S8]
MLKSVGSNWRQAMDALHVQSHVLALRAEGAEVEMRLRSRAAERRFALLLSVT